MLASYGVASHAFVATPVVDYLRAFSGHPAPNQQEAEIAYRLVFDDLHLRLGMNGLQIVREAHEKNLSPPFDAMRAKAVVAYVDDAARLGSSLPSLAAATSAIAVVTVNRGTALLGADSHAVTLGYDSLGWFAFDVNRNDLIPGLVQPADLGQLGDALLVLGL
jgi:hypothetical protein